MDGQNRNNGGFDPFYETPLTYEERKAYDERLQVLFTKICRMTQKADELEEAGVQIKDELKECFGQFYGCEKLLKMSTRDRGNQRNAEQQWGIIE